MWNWQLLEDSDSEQDAVVSGDEPGDAAPSNIEESGSEEAEDDNIPAITHTVVFKRKGCIKRLCYQELLVLANQQLKKGEDIPVKLEKEPSNPYDSNAIAFMCLAENIWEWVGYVVSEALADVNEAISNNKIHQDLDYPNTCVPLQC